MSKHEKTIYQIAEEAGVSIATVSRVLNNTGNVSEKTRRKVMDAIHKFKYVPNLAARTLHNARSTSVGVVIPDICNPFFSEMLQGITVEADKLGINIFLFDSHEQPEREHRALQSMREHRLAGIIIVPSRVNDTETRNLLEQYETFGVPVVLLDRELNNCSFDRVVAADEEGAFRAVSALIECGHTKIAMIAGSEYSKPGLDRRNGYLRAMETASLPVPEGYLRHGDFRIGRAYEEAIALCKLPDPPTAIFSTNNLTSYGCLKAIQDLHMTIQSDMALLGFDDIEPLVLLNVNLSVVIRDATAMGREAMHLLSQRFGKEPRSDEGRRICLPTELILRGSEAYPANR